MGQLMDAPCVAPSRVTQKISINTKINDLALALAIGFLVLIYLLAYLLKVKFFSVLRGISQIWEPTVANLMKIDLYCQRQNCSPLNVYFSSV